MPMFSAAQTARSGHRWIARALAHRPVLLLTLAALLPLVALVAGLAVQSLRQQQSAMQADAVNRAADILGRVERELAAQTELLKVLAQSPSLDGVAPDLARFQKVASRYRNELPLWANVILADMDGRQVVNARVPFGTALPPVVDAEGFARVVATAAPAIGDLKGPGPFTPSGKPLFSVRVPVIREDEVRYVLTATVSTEALSSIVAAPGGSRGWDVVLIDAAGRVVAAPSAPETVGTRADERTLAASAADSEGFYEDATPGDGAILTAFKKSHSTRWSAHVSIPAAIYEAPLVRSAGILTAAGCAALALTLVFMGLLRRATRRPEALKSAILEAALDSVVTIDAANRIVEWNPAAERMFGHPRAAVMGRDLTELVVPPECRHRSGIARWLAPASEGMIGRRVELEALRADGTRLPIELAVSAFSIMGEPHFTAYLRDISERRKAEIELRDSEQRYRLLAENSTDMIVRLDMHGIARYVSPACRDALGRAPEELAGRGIDAFIHPEDRERATASLDDFLAGGYGALQTVTYRALHSSGRTVWLEAQRRLVTDGAGQATEAVSVIRDVTQRLDLEQRLSHAQKMEAVGQLTGGVAHDFNNLLTVILGNAEIITEELADLRLKPLAETIQSAAMRGADLVEKLLTFGRRRPLTPRHVDVNRLVRGMMPLLRRTIGENVDLKTELVEGMPTALTDRALLENAILNLVLNGRDAMPDGGTLTIATAICAAAPDDAALKAGQKLICLAVTDSGIGMPPDIRERAFEPFFTTKEVGKGSGLGLSMVYGFVRQTGGTVLIESAIGQGTSVRMLLPVPVDTAAAQGEEPEEPEYPSSMAGGDERVLVVEDEPAVLQIVASQLTSFGYRVTAVSTAQDAVAMLRQGGRVDLLFTDVVLPRGMSGIDLVRAARAARPDIRVLLTSGYPDEAFAKGGLPGDDVMLLRKPYKRRELAETVRRVLGTAA